MSGQTDNTGDDEDEFNKRWSGFDFCRLSGVTILTFIFVVAALIIDDLAFASKREEECGGQQGNVCDIVHSCKVTARCGSSGAKIKYEKALGGTTTIAATQDPFRYCGAYPAALNHQTTDVLTTDYKVKYIQGCNDSPKLLLPIELLQIRKDSCNAYNAGNIWWAFCIASLVVNILTMLLLLPLYCKHKSLFPCECCNTRTALILGLLFTLTWVFQLIAAGYFMIIQPCDTADLYFRYNFTEPTTNILSFSIGLVLISAVANCVGCGTVCFCWGDNREYGEDPNETDKEYAIKPSTRKDPFKTQDNIQEDEGEY
mmetsp:Transcript_106686/g.130098  ORF Transcript_106686/g.130098 Transcript_106686/m.130098 type:complete len:314 (-) Transcript_106686:163-1104(-)